MCIGCEIIINIYFFYIFHFAAAPSAVRITSVLNRKNVFAQRAKLVQKLQRRKAAESNCCDKVFIGFENLVMLFLFLPCQLILITESYLVKYKYHTKTTINIYL